MLGRPLLIEWDPEDTPGSLREKYLAERDPLVRPRLQALWLVRDGMTLVDASEVVGVHSGTLGKWVRWYRRGGLKEVVSGHNRGGPGRAPSLSPEQDQAVVDEVATGRFRTAMEIRDWVESEFGVSYTRFGIYRVLKRLKCKRKVPRPRHIKADVARQEAWKKGGSVAALQKPT